MVATGSTKELDDKKFTYYMTGREFSDNIFVPKNVSDKPVFELKHLTLNGSFSDINLSLRRGEILGITGLLDSGRTELGLSMFGLKPADSGQIIKDGKEIKLTSQERLLPIVLDMFLRTDCQKAFFLPSRLVTTSSFLRLTN